MTLKGTVPNGKSRNDKSELERNNSHKWSIRVFLSDTRPKLVTELLYPPIEITTLQRANNRGEQIFYGFFGYKTAFVESRVRINEFVIISEWVNIDDLVLIQIGLSPEKDALNEVKKLLHDIFTWSGDEMYEYSAIIAFHLFRGNVISGIIYPSISSEFESHNVGIHKEFVDKSMEFRVAYLYQVTGISAPEEYEVNEIAFAVVTENGKLSWATGRTDKLYF